MSSSFFPLRLLTKPEVWACLLVSAFHSPSLSLPGLTPPKARNRWLRLFACFSGPGLAAVVEGSRAGRVRVSGPAVFAACPALKTSASIAGVTLSGVAPMVPPFSTGLTKTSSGTAGVSTLEAEATFAPVTSCLAGSTVGCVVLAGSFTGFDSFSKAA